ncbi:MAG: ketoacyl-ACP synthase III [Anaerolineaceae bacterium]|nr:ketoacyl-ACP synthase III [Anaerolineaceae bacterium]
MKKAAIQIINYYLPEKTLTNEELAKIFPEWPAQQIYKKTGIKTRHIAADNETASDLAFHAAQDLFNQSNYTPDDIDMVMLCTQSPDYVLPTSACTIQNRLGIPSSAGAFDYNLGCSGYVYGLSIAKGLIESGSANTVLLLTGNTYSKFMHVKDKNVRTIFGDAGTATLIQGIESEQDIIGPFTFGTDGAGADKLIVKVGGTRFADEQMYLQGGGEKREDGLPNSALFMDGPSIFSFTLRVVPKMLKSLFTKTGLVIDDIDHFVFHQANKFMLDSLRRQSRIPEEKFILDMENIGNTISSTIPIALANAKNKGMLKEDEKVVLVSFGVGLSWAACLMKIAGNFN